MAKSRDRRDAAPEYRDMADRGFFSLLFEIPRLTRNLAAAEFQSAKGWLRSSGADAGWGALWVLVALFVLFWSVPVFGTFAIAGLSSWWPVWLSAIVIFVAMLIVAVLFALIAFRQFLKIPRRESPWRAAETDRAIMRDPQGDLDE